MREIKFRGVVINDTKGCNGEYIYGYLTKELDNFYIEVPEMDIMLNAFQVNPETVGQFTGLKDKNGTDIYEGDILLYISTNMSDMEVKFENGCFVGEGPFNTHTLISYVDALDFESLEIISNIHEND